MKSLQMTYLELQIEYWLQILVIQAIWKVYFLECYFSVSVGFLYYSIYPYMCLYLWFNNGKKKMDIVFWLEL